MKTQTITSKTKIKVGDDVMAIANEAFAQVIKIVGNTYYILFDVDTIDDRPSQRSRTKLEKHWVLVK
jgi:hypothetical protein